MFGNYFYISSYIKYLEIFIINARHDRSAWLIDPSLLEPTERTSSSALKMKSLSFLGLIALSLQCMGIWPFVTRNRTLYLLNLFFRLFCCFCWAQYQFGVLANIFLTEDDITEITKMISLDLAVFNVSVKATPLVLYRDYYLQLKEKVDRFVENEMKHSEKNYQLIYKKSKSLNFLAK